MYFNNIYYPYYPKIREKDIGVDTSNMFVDTLSLSNLYLKGMGADFDGDQVTVKSVYLEEANNELEEFMNNNKQEFINFGSAPLRPIVDDVNQTIFALTRVLPDMKDITTNIQYA